MKTLSPRISGIYAITHKASGRQYIGSAVHIPARRRVHLCVLRKNRHHSSKLQRAWNKHGEEAFTWSTLELCPIGLLIEREQVYLDQMKPFYNTSLIAGSQLGHKHNEQSRAKMSAVQQRNRLNIDIRKNISEGTRKGQSNPVVHEKMSQAAFERWANEDYRTKMSTIRKGKKPSEQARAKMSEAMKRRHLEKRQQLGTEGQTSKPCKICQKTIALEEFPVDNRNADGRAARCLVCDRKIRAELQKNRRKSS